MTDDRVIFESENGKVFVVPPRESYCTETMYVTDYAWSGDQPGPPTRFAGGMEADLAREIVRLRAEREWQWLDATRIYPPAVPAAKAGEDDDIEFPVPFCTFINSVADPDLEVIKPIPITIEQRGPDEFLSNFWDAGVHFGGESVGKAIRSIQDIIATEFKSCLQHGEAKLGPMMLRNHRVMKEFIRDKRTAAKAGDGDWIDIETQRPPLRERVVILIPFGMRVADDTWTDEGWLNTDCYVSHWKPINPPGTYTEIMQRPQKGEPLPVPNKERTKNFGAGFSEAVREHLAMMNSVTATQFLLRLEARVTAPAGDEGMGNSTEKGVTHND